MASIEERVEDLFKKTLDDLNITRYPKTESINRVFYKDNYRQKSYLL